MFSRLICGAQGVPGAQPTHGKAMDANRRFIHSPIDLSVDLVAWRGLHCQIPVRLDRNIPHRSTHADRPMRAELIRRTDLSLTNNVNSLAPWRKLLIKASRSASAQLGQCREAAAHQLCENATKRAGSGNFGALVNVVRHRHLLLGHRFTCLSCLLIVN